MFYKFGSGTLFLPRCIYHYTPCVKEYVFLRDAWSIFCNYSCLFCYQGLPGRPGLPGIPGIKVCVCLCVHLFRSFMYVCCLSVWKFWEYLCFWSNWSLLLHAGLQRIPWASWFSRQQGTKGRMSWSALW